MASSGSVEAPAVAPVGAGRRRRRRRPPEVVVVLGVGLLAAVLSWVRLPTQSRGVVWAEDGFVFLQGWLDAPTFPLLTPYDGYLHLVPRLLVGGVAELAAPTAFADVTTAACCAVVGLLAAVVWVCTVDVVRSPWSRLLLAMLTPLAPPAAAEVLGNAANLHWYFLWASLFVVLHRPRTWPAAVTLSVVALLGALSEIQVGLWVPLVLLLQGGARLAARRGAGRSRVLLGPAPDLRSSLVHLALVAGVAAQVAVTLGSPRPDRTGAPPSVLSVVEGFLAGPVWSAVTGRAPVQGVLVNHLGFVAPAALLVGVVVLVACALAGGGPRGLAAVGCTLGAVVVFAAAVVLNPTPSFAFASYSRADWAGWVPPRYVVLPALLLLGAAVLGADSLLTSSRGAARLSAASVLVVVLVVAVGNLRPSFTGRTGQDDWSTEVVKAERRCDRGRDPVHLAIAPGDGYVVLPCTTLRAWVGQPDVSGSRPAPGSGSPS